MDSNINPPRDLLVFQLTRELVNVSKFFLVSLEDIRDAKNLLTEEDFLYYRKKVLDNSNDSIRKIKSLLEHFEIHLQSPK